ncbi:MAG: THUMP-like domain-containing protein [Microbacteriaceae bacterium]
MEPADLRELFSAEGLGLLNSLPNFESTRDVVRTVAELRKAGHSPTLVAAVLGQSKLRSRAVAKFGEFATRMLFTEAGLEQATRLQVAALHAGRFRDAGITTIADLGCGIGADALAMAAIELEVTAVERDEVTAAIATYNLAPWDNATVRLGSAEDVDLTGFDGAYLDPARRNSRSRRADPADFTPSLEFAFGVGERMPTGVKLGPGIDRDLIPHDVEAQWVSVDREVVELGVWFGPLRRPGIGRSALVIGSHGTAELSAEHDSDDATIGDLGRFMWEPDGAVIRARLIGDLARNHGARMVSEQIAWFTTDDPINTPFAQGFEVCAVMPFDERKIKRELSTRGIGTLEIKKRGIDVDPAELRKRLRLVGDGTATLILTRIQGRRTAIIAARLPQAG